MSVNRCPSCGAKPEHGHLLNCKIARMPGGELWDKPTVPMIDKANELLRELGRDGTEDPANMTFERCSALIDRLLAEKAERGEDEYA